MSREWKPGDVALVKNEYDVWNRAICAVRQGQPNYVWSFGVADDFEALDADARPLVVIDPEDDRQVRVLATMLANRVEPGGWPTNLDLADALREFARPTPPKPEEPKSVGAIVEADFATDKGRRGQRFLYARAEDGSWSCLTDGCTTELGIAWPFLVDVRVLSSGVEVTS